MAKFFIIALTVMLVMQGYVSWHVWRVLPFSTPVKVIIILLMLAALACMVMQFKSDTMPLGLATAVYEIGNSWLIIMFYLMLIFLLLDIGRIIHLVPATWLKDNAITSLTITGALLVTLVAGNIHYHNKVRQEIHLTTSKQLERPLKIVMLSDLHAGYHNRRAEVGRWVDMVNAEHPDMILITGDIIDGRMRPLLEQGTSEEFKRLEAPVIACLGNHEYISGIDKSIDWIKQSGIRLLIDETVNIGDVTVIGRDDRSNYTRKSVNQLVQGVTRDNYLILLDHQPYHLEEAEQNGIDLQLSGHTHRGQIWPLSLVVKSMYECAYGQWKRGKTDYYVSSGMGIWGGKFRVGTDSEYAVITITPKNN